MTVLAGERPARTVNSIAGSCGVGSDRALFRPARRRTEPDVTAPSRVERRPDPTEDSVLVQASQTDPQRFAELYDRHAPDIHRYAARRLGDSAADDVVAETFLVAFRRRDRFDPSRGAARPWLYGIASNLIAGHRRSEVMQYRVLAKTAVDPVVEGHHERSDSRVAAAAVTRQLGAALARLSKGDRDVLVAGRVGVADLRRGGTGAGDSHRDSALPTEPGSQEGPEGARWSRPHRGTRGVQPWMR